MKKILLLFLTISSAVSAQHITNTGIGIVNTGKLITNGDWVNAAGSALKNDGTIITSESWTNNGTLSGTGAFVLNYSADKNFKPGSPLFGSLTKTGTGAALVSGSIHLTDSLLLNNGLVKLGATDTLWMKSGIVQAAPTSYIEGLVAHSGQGDKIFPFGRDGNALTMRLIKFDATKATASVVAAPAGYTAGPGVEALIAFPYVWKVSEKIAADTSAYVEVNYPNTLPTATNPIITREVPGSKYASMGARLIDTSNGRVTVRSYSRGLKGTFTVAKGFPGNFKTDSLALVALYNNTTGTGWTTKTNWLTTTVDKWFGVTVTGQSITSVNLANNKLTGVVPDPLVDILSLQTVNLSSNAITAIPNFSDNKQITTLNVSNNKLEFGSLEPNKGFVNATGITFNYATQGDYGQPTTTLVDVGTNYTAESKMGGTNNAYQWKRNGTVVTGATSKTYAINAINRANMGDYVAEVTNSYFPGLMIKTAANSILATATMSGKLLANTTTAATKGKVTVLKITKAGGYDTIPAKTINTDGAYKFEKMVLDDYKIVGFVDTLTYAKALPTYYTNTIFWEESSTVALNANADNLTITTQYKPGPSPTGIGVISGTITERVGSGRTAVDKRVPNAGCAVRRVERTGRTEGETLTLVGYVFSNANGEFVLPKLEKGEYRLNIQYPGYPMDETSYVTIPIGDGLQSQVKVAANVQDGKIKVQKLIVTGIWEKEEYKAEVFPNPSTEYIQLKFATTSQNRLMKLIDISGREIQTTNAGELEVKTDVRNLEAGIYLLQISDHNQVVKTVRVVKE